MTEQFNLKKKRVSFSELISCLEYSRKEDSANSTDRLNDCLVENTKINGQRVFDMVSEIQSCSKTSNTINNLSDNQTEKDFMNKKENIFSNQSIPNELNATIIYEATHEDMDATLGSINSDADRQNDCMEIEVTDVHSIVHFERQNSKVPNNNVTIYINEDMSIDNQRPALEDGNFDISLLKSIDQSFKKESQNFISFDESIKGNLDVNIIKQDNYLDLNLESPIISSSTRIIDANILKTLIRPGLKQNQYSIINRHLPNNVTHSSQYNALNQSNIANEDITKNFLSFLNPIRNFESNIENIDLNSNMFIKSNLDSPNIKTKKKKVPTATLR